MGRESMRGPAQGGAKRPESGVLAVNETRLGALLRRIAEFGFQGEGKGIDRQALSDAEIGARRYVVEYAREYGAEVSRDRVGNLFCRWSGSGKGPPVMTGSHLDSQPQGGALDGAYGVCVGLEVIAALSQVRGDGYRPIELAVWTNEEGCRFAPGTMGSSAFVGPGLLETYLEASDSDGVKFRDELRKLDEVFSDVPIRVLGGEVAFLVEAHIEQGRQLEEAGVPIGVVKGSQGVRWFRVRIMGRAGHAGTTLLRDKEDALMSAVEILEWLYGKLLGSDEHLYITVGRLAVYPGSINVIPGEVVFTVDVRHPDEEVLDEIEKRLKERVEGVRWGSGEVERLMAMPPQKFSRLVREVVAGSALSLGLDYRCITSGAFHDACRFVRHCPTGMVFVPSIGGISHSPEERTEEKDLMAGARVIGETMVRLARL